MKRKDETIDQGGSSKNENIPASKNKNVGLWIFAAFAVVVVIAIIISRFC